MHLNNRSLGIGGQPAKLKIQVGGDSHTMPRQARQPIAHGTRIRRFVKLGKTEVDLYKRTYFKIKTGQNKPRFF